jgi:hypothetical protein
MACRKVATAASRVILTGVVCGVVFVSAGPALSGPDKNPTLHVSEAERAACMPDAVRFCRKSLPNVYKVLICFRNHRAKISSGCNAVLAGYGL